MTAQTPEFLAYIQEKAGMTPEVFAGLPEAAQAAMVALFEAAQAAGKRKSRATGAAEAFRAFTPATEGTTLRLIQDAGHERCIEGVAKWLRSLPYAQRFETVEALLTGKAGWDRDQITEALKPRAYKKRGAKPEATDPEAPEVEAPEAQEAPEAPEPKAKGKKAKAK